MSSILTVKLADVNAVKFKPPSELLKKAKGATWEYNKQHKRKNKLLLRLLFVSRIYS